MRTGKKALILLLTGALVTVAAVALWRTPITDYSRENGRWEIIHFWRPMN